MKLRNAFLCGALATAVFTSCSKDKDNNGGPSEVHDSTSVSGQVSGVWKKGTIVKVTNHLEVPAGQSLTIEEGVTVLMSDSVIKPEFIVKGNLYCMGTAQNPVKITVPDAWKTTGNKWGNLWGGITAAPTSAELLMVYTDLSYGGAVTTANSPSVKGGLYKAEAGNAIPALNYSNTAGKLVVMNSAIHNFYEDAFYIEGGNVIFSNNVFYTTGIANGEAVNLKSGVLAEVAFNTIYNPNTNGMKLSNSGDRTQIHMIGYNNTIVNAGWRRPTTKGGSIWVEKSVFAELYNNLLVNDRYGIKRDKVNKEDARSIFSNTFYYGYTQEVVDQFQPTEEVIAGTNDVISATVKANDPLFVNYPVSTARDNADFNTSWDFHVQAGSPVLGKGTTTFTRIFPNGIKIKDVTYTAPAPATYAGAWGTK